MKRIILIFVFINTLNIFAKEDIKYYDKLFIQQMSNMKSIPSSTVQNWFRVQKAFYEVNEIINEASNERDKAFAQYVLAFGYNNLRLYDINLNVLTNIKESEDNHLNYDIMKDKAALYEDLGDINMNFKIRETIFMKYKSYLDYRDTLYYSFGLMRNKKYNESIEMLTKLKQDTNYYDFHYYLALAYAFNLDYANSNLVLEKLSYKNKNYSEYLKDIGEQGNEKFWLDKIKLFNEVSKPRNIIKENDIVVDASLNISKYAINMWYDEAYNLYSGMLDSNWDGSPSRPFNLRNYPNKIVLFPNAKFAFSIVDAVPIMTLQFQNILDFNISRDDLKTYLSYIHAPSFFDEKMTVNNNFLFGVVNNKVIAFVTHSSWHEELIKNKYSNVKWELLK